MKLQKATFSSWYTLITIIITSTTVYAHNNQITKVFHHQAPSNELELGQVVLYFAKDPKVSTSLAHGDNRDELTLSFAHTQVTDQAQAMLTRIIAQPVLDSYTISEKPGNKADASIIRISYDPHKVLCEYETFVAIDLQKGLIVRLYNKELLDKLNATKNRVLLRTAHLDRKSNIIIDCGHGGKDSGAVGLNGIQEKDVALDVGLQLAVALKSDGYKVALTRMADEFLELDERTKIANFKGDLLVSIHANNSPRFTATGIETFALTPNLFTYGESFSDVCPSPVVRLAQAHRCNKSVQLATCLQNNMYDSLKKKYSNVANRGVKHSVAQVLLGTLSGPAVLAEIGFVMDLHLSEPEYQRCIVQGLRKGINDFFIAQA